MNRKILLLLSIVAVAVFFRPLLLSAQTQQDPQQSEEDDKYVRLMSAQSVQLLEIGGRTFRKAEGPARFLHNNTWLICDTALWDVDAQIIHAKGNVSIEQDNTELTSDSLTYFVERDMAEFRGALVQLRDKDNNVLRTNNLDYNTKDSVAVFRSGGAMRDKDGQIIESNYGKYESKIHLFTFNREVNMFTDSVFVKTVALLYDSKTTVATYPNFVEAWKDDKTLSANEGWYNRGEDLFFFKNDVHMMSDTQEGWCDSLFYNRRLRSLRMMDNAQVCDRSRGVSAMAGDINYTDSISTVKITDDPVVLMEVDQKDSLTTTRDSVYFRADSITYWTIKRCDIDAALMSLSSSRLSTIAEDPVENIRKKAAEEAAKRAEEAAAKAAENDPNRPPQQQGGEDAGSQGQADVPETSAPPMDMSSSEPSSPPEGTVPPAPPADSFSPDGAVPSGADSLAQAGADSLALSDSLASQPLKDTTAVGFLEAHGSVKIFRKKMQVCCDSLRYTDLDSLARLYKDPIIWNEIRHQYQADSVWARVHEGKMDKANLMSNAFVMINENDVLFDQIKGAEMAAFFDGDSQLRRFDAIGGSSAIFYIKEKKKLSTANKKEATILSADFEKGELQGITYFETPKSDVYPIAQMKESDKRLKGFSWRPELRPKSPSELSSRVFRQSQRKEYEGHYRPSFDYTRIYFPGYMEKIQRELDRADSLRKHSSISGNDSLGVVAADSLSGKDSLGILPLPADSLSLRPMTAADSLAQMLPDSLGFVSVGDDFLIQDDVKALPDSAYLTPKPEPTPAQIRAEQRRQERARAQAEWEAKRARKDSIRQAKWDALDARDALKQAKKDAKKTARREAKEARKKAKMEAFKAKQDALREHYKQLYLTKWKKQLLKSISTGSGEPSSS